MIYSPTSLPINTVRSCRDECKNCLYFSQGFSSVGKSSHVFRLLVAVVLILAALLKILLLVLIALPLLPLLLLLLSLQIVLELRLAVDDGGGGTGNDPVVVEEK